MRVGFIGLGIMGRPMAHRLLDAGFPLVVYNRTASRCRSLAEAGAAVAASPAQAARTSDVVLIIVNDTPDVQSILFGPHGVAQGIGSGKIVVDMSTIAPAATVASAQRLAHMGVEMLDAPVSGGESGALAGTLTIMVGGAQSAFDRCLPLFQAMGRNIARVGPSGSGHLVKLVNQVLCGIHIVAMNEALAFARKAGVDPHAALEVVASGAAGSWMLTHVGPKALADNFAPGFKIKLQQKDLRLARECLHKLGLASPALEHAYRQFTRALEEGWGELGTEALIKLYP